MANSQGYEVNWRRPRVAVFGEWGETNLGDWAIYHGVADFFAQADAAIDAYRCGALRPFQLPQAPPAARSTPRARPGVLNGTGSAARLLKRSVRGWRQEWLVRRLMPQLAQADLVCVGGGALLCDRNLHFPQSLVAIARAVQVLRKPLWCLGCSVDGEWTERGRQMILEFLETCDAIAVRDQATAARLAAATGRNVPLFGDFALPSQPTPRTDLAARRYVLGMNVSQIPAPWDAYQGRYEDALVTVASRFLIEAQRTPKIALFTTGTPQDDAPLERVQARLAAAGTEAIRPASLTELHQVLDQSEIVIATRLHAAIVALARGRPAIGLSPSPKIGSFLESIGLGEFFVRIPDSDAEAAINLMGRREALDRQWQRMDQSVCWNTRRELQERLRHLAQRSMAS